MIDKPNDLPRGRKAELTHIANMRRRIESTLSPNATEQFDDVLAWLDEELENLWVLVMDEHERSRRVTRLMPAKMPEVYPVGLDEVAQWAAKYWGIDFDLVRCPLRTKRVAGVRHVVLWFLNTMFGATLAEIGKLLNRDHSTVCYARDKINAERVRNPRLQKELTQMMNAFKAQYSVERADESVA